MTVCCRETADGELIASVLNHPSLAPVVRGATQQQEGWRYFEIIGGGGLICFQPVDDGWLIHSLALERKSAARAITEALQAVSEKVTAIIPINHLAALRAGIHAGMKYIGRTEENHILEHVHG